MIKTRKQYEEARKMLAKHNRDYAVFLMIPVTASTEFFWHGHKAGMEYVIAMLGKEIREFEDLTSGQSSLPPLENWTLDPELLIKWRLHKQWSQKELADELGVSFDEMARFERDNFEDCPLELKLRIKDILENEKPNFAYDELNDATIFLRPNRQIA